MKELSLNDFESFIGLIDIDCACFICDIANEYNKLCKKYNDARDASDIYRYPIVTSSTEVIYIFITCCLKHFEYRNDIYGCYQNSDALGIISNGSLDGHYYALLGAECITDISQVSSIDLMNYNYSDNPSKYVGLYEDILYNNILSEAIANIRFSNYCTKCY